MSALLSLAGGIFNTAYGAEALMLNSNGSNNIAVGTSSDINFKGGYSTIHLGAPGPRRR